MDSTPLDFESLAEARREAASASMQPVTIEALRELAERLFPQPDHPWQPLFSQFLTDHANSPAVQGEVGQGMHYVFFPCERKGIWYHLDSGVAGMGPIQERGLAALAAIAEDKGIL